MKQINLTSIKLREIIVTDNSITVLYEVLDENNNVVKSKSKNFLITDLPTAGESAVNTLKTKVTNKLEIIEGL